MMALVFAISDISVGATADAKRPMAAVHLTTVDAVIQQAIHEGQIPGAVLLVGTMGT
jgi:hypothetical protein